MMLTKEQREESIRVLNNIYTECMDEDKAIQYAIFALRGPQPDPETGLMPCGCGGKAEIIKDLDSINLLPKYRAYCPKSLLTTRWHSSVCEAVDDWNIAMGYALPTETAATCPDDGKRREMH